MSVSIRGERLVITLLGNRNAGKSSLINAIVGQEIAIVSDTPGTTTDPVDKRYELIPIGPVTFYDTAGLDDEGELGQKRVKATLKVLFRTDMAVLVNDGSPFNPKERETIARVKEMEIPLLVVFNKGDLGVPATTNIEFCSNHSLRHIIVSSSNQEHIEELKELLIELAPLHLKQEKVLVGDLIKAGDKIILVTPIDKSAPKGRMILPQVQVLRDLLDYNAVVTFAKETELALALEALKEPPALVVTDSQAIELVAKIVPLDVPLTTFSILFARYKGELEILAQGVRQIDHLQPGDKVLIAEACSHHVQDDDIGKYKLPRWIEKYLGFELVFESAQGHDFPDNLEDYKLVIHCGACMLNQAEMGRRIMEAHRRHVPISNYGLAITKVQGVFERCVQVYGI